MRCRLALAILALALASCEQAVRYPATDGPHPPVADTKKKPTTLSPHYAWIRPNPTAHEVPIEFVPAAAPGWGSLPKFWNPFPPPAAGMRTIHFGLPPLPAVAALVAADQAEAIRIKVPLGLPDPNPLIPAANPPTYPKWRLGKKLFFDAILKAGSLPYACADCHQPGHGFAEARPKALNGVINTPGLLNAIYNRHQFWDGRAGALEEVLVRSLEDERPPEEDPARESPEVTHSWGGLVKALAKDDAYRLEFYRTFGIAQPTQDAIAKALATYVRTILAGDSLYDRAEARRQGDGKAALSAEHFFSVLDDAAFAALQPGLKKEDAARQFAAGYQLFHGKANCAACHRPPLFTDHDFHNIGLNPQDSLPPPEKLTGRFLRLPIGLKEMRLIGAYRTPSLRGLPRTAPYFHDGKRHGLKEVVTFYDHEILATPYLAEALRAGDREQNLRLSPEETDALVLFLRSLDGSPVDPIVAAPPS
jgi:cytochrome c peroxidase